MTAAYAPRECPACEGTGQISVAVHIGRGNRRRQVADQEATCLDCLGAGTTSDEPAAQSNGR
ncbi:hypothetical protein GCM10009759_39480 [Kitasatospora saccharophila]|uniref:Molecular chaperone DnaJ n=1 Tax=Kitasatospora saccharophila TaxID=407973 RepID=A0ABP5IRS5_9ACTN